MDQSDVAKVMIARDRFLAFVQEHVDWVARCLADPSETWSPKLTVLAKTPPHYEEKTYMLVVATDFNEHEDKHSIMRFMGEKFYKDERMIPMVAVMSTEAWVSESRQGAPSIQPRDDPARQEAMVVQGLSLDRKLCCMAVMPISHAGGKIVPEKFGPLMEGAACALLESFYEGFFAGPRKKLAEMN